MRRLFSLLLALCVLCGFAWDAAADGRRSGAIDFGLDFHHSMGGHNVLGIHARAMAADRVPGTLVGRFGEMYASLGAGLKGEFVYYSVGFKLGVGLGTNYFVFFLASGLMSDSYKGITKDGNADEVKPGLGVPLMLGFWIDPIPQFYLFLFAEPSWAFFGDRKTEPFIPFNWAWELRLRGGIGFDVSNIHVRLEYTFHQVAPDSWHVVSIGFGVPSAKMAKLGDAEVKK